MDGLNVSLPKSFTNQESNDNTVYENEVDATVFVKDVTYLIEYKQNGDVSSVINGIQYLRK